MSDLFDDDVRKDSQKEDSKLGLNRDVVPKKLFNMNGSIISEDRNLDNLREVDFLTRDVIAPVMDELFTRERFEDLLGVFARFYNNSARNALATYAQQPDANMVLGIKQWKALGCYVVDGAEGVSLIAPSQYRSQSNRNIYRGFKVGMSYDISMIQPGKEVDPFVNYVMKKISNKLQPETSQTLGPILIRHMVKPLEYSGKNYQPFMKHNPELSPTEIRYNPEKNKIELNVETVGEYICSTNKGTMDLLKSLMAVKFKNFNLDEVHIGGRELAIDCAAHVVAKYFDFDDGGLADGVFEKTLYDANNVDMKLNFLDNISFLSRDMIKCIEEIDYNTKNEYNKKYPNF